MIRYILMLLADLEKRVEKEKVKTEKAKQSKEDRKQAKHGVIVLSKLQ